MRASILLGVVALLACGCADNPAPAPVMMVGGYAPADKANPDVKAAESLAVNEIYKREPQRSLAETIMREQQVVAGMNYRFTIKMSGENSYRIVVFRPLQGEMQVTGFEKIAGR